MITRPRLAWASAAALAAMLLWRNSPSELAHRLRFLSAYAPREVAVRRLGGSSTAFDRPFFIFLESARRRMPRGVTGVAVVVPKPSDAALYLAAYEMAPIPVALSPVRAPRGWIVAMYGDRRPQGWRVVAELPGGALLEPAPS